MIKKESLVLAISAVVIIIAGGIAMRSQAEVTQAKKQVAELNAVVLKNESESAKLIMALKTAQTQLASVKAELDTIKMALADANAKINAASQQTMVQPPAMPKPVAEISQTVTK